MKLVNLLKNKFICDNPLSIKDLYVNSTIEKLTSFIQNNQKLKKEKIIYEQEVKLDQTIIPLTSSYNCYINNKRYNIFITGGSGFVGSHLIKELTDNKLVDKIYCLVQANTKGEAINKIQNALYFYNINCSTEKIIPLIGTLSKKNFGLNIEEYDRISNDIDIIIHNATFMNHLLTYHALKQVNVQGTEEILSFACTSKQKIVNVVSTTNIFTSNLANKIYDEDTAIYNEEHYHNDGYSSSKWVTEGLCDIARQRGINCNIYIDLV